MTSGVGVGSRATAGYGRAWSDLSKLANFLDPFSPQFFALLTKCPSCLFFYSALNCLPLASSGSPPRDAWRLLRSHWPTLGLSANWGGFSSGRLDASARPSEPRLGNDEIPNNSCEIPVGLISRLQKTASNSKVRVETSTEFATRVPDTHYPTGTRVLITVNLVSD